MKIVGLTGGIASGKSCAARILSELGATVIDADRVARAIVEPGQPAMAAILKHFGPTVLGEDGRLDRGAMRALISRDAEARRTLDKITHPRIRAQIVEELAQLHAQGAAVAFVEAALLVETGAHMLYPELWVVSCSPQTQLHRLMRRDNMTEEQALAMIGTQLPLADKEAHADRVFHNDGELNVLRVALTAAYEVLLST